MLLKWWEYRYLEMDEKAGIKGLRWVEYDQDGNPFLPEFPDYPPENLTDEEMSGVEDSYYCLSQRLLYMYADY